MREIKYEAYHFEAKKMFRVSAMNFGSKGDLHVLLETGAPPYKSLYGYGLSEVALREFTGLKDKNGKEIYEGDIVEAWSAGSKGVFEIKWRQGGSPSWILYPAYQNKEMWSISATEHYKGKQFINVDASVETSDRNGFYDDGLQVIGTIYENPELLNPNK